jgi:hypothetical protein
VKCPVCGRSVRGRRGRAVLTVDDVRMTLERVLVGRCKCGHKFVNWKLEISDDGRQVGKQGRAGRAAER